MLGTALLAALLVSFSGLPALLGRAGSFVAELVLVVLGAVLTLRVARSWLGTLRERTMLHVAITLVALIGVGQIVRTKKLYPLLPYTMYGRAAEGDATFYEYEALHRSGARDRFRPSTVIATLGRARVVKGLARELDAIAALEAKGRSAERERALLRDTMSALIRYHNGSHANDPVVQVDVVQVALPAPYFPNSARRRTIMRLPVEKAR